MNDRKDISGTVEERAPGTLIYGYEPGQYRRFRRFAYQYLIAFCFLYCTLYCSRLSLANAGGVLMRELDFSKTDIGILTSVLFWSYAVGQLINGRLSDLTSPGKLIVLSVILSSLCNLLISTQTKLLPMALIWGLNGFAQSMAWAPGIAVITKWWPGKKRGFATGFALAFSGFGQVVAILSAVFSLKLFPSLGWRSVFLVSAAIPLIMLMVYFVFARTSPAKVALPEYREDEDVRIHEDELTKESRSHGVLYAYRYVLSERRFRTWILIVFLAGLTRHGLSTWVPMYFIDAYGINITSGLLQSLPLPLGMGIGTIVVPWLTDKFCPDNRLIAVIFSAFTAAVIVSVFVLLNPLIPWQRVLIYFCLFTAGFCIYAISGTSGAYATDVGGRVFSGTSTGLLSFSAYVGAALQSLIYGVLLDKVGWILVFVSIAVFSVITGFLALSHTKRKSR